MNIAVSHSTIDNYFRFLKHLDIDSKKNLIIKLTASINTKDMNKYDFSSCYGSWNDSRNAEDIINELREARTNNKEIEEF